MLGHGSAPTRDENDASTDQRDSSQLHYADRFTEEQICSTNDNHVSHAQEGISETHLDLGEDGDPKHDADRIARQSAEDPRIEDNADGALCELKHALVGHQRNIRHAFAKEKLRTRIEGYGEQNEWDEFEIHAINFGMMRRHYQWRVAAITMISPARPTPWLTRSRAANTMGSSCMSPRWATNQARLIQYSSTGQSSQSTWGVAYSLRLSGLL